MENFRKNMSFLLRKIFILYCCLICIVFAIRFLPSFHELDITLPLIEEIQILIYILLINLLLLLHICCIIYRKPDLFFFNHYLIFFNYYIINNRNDYIINILMYYINLYETSESGEFYE